MVRPRLSKLEIEFLLEMLKDGKGNVQKKLRRLDELLTEVYRLRKLLRVSPYDALKLGFKEKKQELEKLEAECTSLHHHITIYEGLCSRFQNLLAGKQRGRLQAKVQLGQLFLRIEKGGR